MWSAIPWKGLGTLEKEVFGNRTLIFRSSRPVVPKRFTSNDHFSNYIQLVCHIAMPYTLNCFYSIDHRSRGPPDYALRTTDWEPLLQTAGSCSHSHKLLTTVTVGYRFLGCDDVYFDRNLLTFLKAGMYVPDCTTSRKILKYFGKYIELSCSFILCLYGIAICNFCAVKSGYNDIGLCETSSMMSYIFGGTS